MQRWKIVENLLIDKAGLWNSVDSWTFITEDDDEICIQNTSNTMVLGATSENKVIQESLVEDKDAQLWRKGVPDSEGYFTLQNSEGLTIKVLTAISDSSLEIKGNIQKYSRLRCLSKVWYFFFIWAGLAVFFSSDKI